MSGRLYKKVSECCGCEACAEVCPKGIIKMRSDAEGFMYPYVVKPELCVNCGKCENVCPIKNICNVLNFQEIAIAGYSKDQLEIQASASGGLATAIAQGFIEQKKGIVYGVAYTKNFLGAEYKRVATIKELDELRTSKYIQARKNNVYWQVQRDLCNGLNVLFFGLPCETYALQLYLEKEYTNLYVCSLICHGPSSPKVQEQYINIIMANVQDKLKSFSVRYKKEGWKPYYIRAQFENGKEYIEQFNTSIYGVAFNYFKRPSCNRCQIKRSKIHSDLTIGDYHLASGGQAKPYNPDGVSSAVLHTDKGENLISIAKNFYFEKIPVKNVLYSEAYHRCIPSRRNRKEFGVVFSQKGFAAACMIKSIARIEKELSIKKHIKIVGASIKRALLKKHRNR